MSRDFTLDDFMAEQPFIDQARIEEMVNALRQRLTLVLAGPTGSGKSWTAKGIARMVHQGQEPHQTLVMHIMTSERTFVHGIWQGNKGLLIHAMETAIQNPGLTHVVVIEDANRGNLPAAAGPLWPLFDHGRRGSQHAVEIDDLGPVWIPENLAFIITTCTGAMIPPQPEPELPSTFPRFTLGPSYNEAWLRCCVNMGIPENLALVARARVESVNVVIANDPALGPDYRIMHSYLTPGEPQDDGRQWLTDALEQVAIAAKVRLRHSPPKQRMAEAVITPPLPYT